MCVVVVSGYIYMLCFNKSVSVTIYHDCMFLLTPQDVIKSGVIAVFLFCGAIALAVYGNEWNDILNAGQGAFESIVRRITLSVQTAAVSSLPQVLYLLLK